MKRLGFNSKLLLCLLMLCARPFGAARAQESIDIGAEVWIEPGQTPEQIDGWFSLAANNGMRSVRLFLMWNYIEKQPGEFDFSLYDTAFAAANRHKVRIEATLCAIHGPAWLSEKFRGRPQFNELFDSEQVLVRAAEYIRQTVTRYRDDQALESWWVLNEPRRFDPRSPLATARLQERAAAKYSTVEAVNEAWIEHYTDFSQIVYNPLWERGNYFYWPVPTVDWYQFQRDFLTWNLRWIADNIRRYDTRHIITMNPANVFESAHQYNLPAYREIFDVYGASMHASWQLRLLPRDNYGYAVAGISEILRGAAPEGRFWVSELQGGNNIWSGKTPMCPDSLDLAQWIWTGIGSGARKVVYWSLNYRKQGIEAGEWGVFGFRSEATDRSRVTAEMNRVLARHNDFFSGAKPWQGTVTLLLSPETMRLLLHIDPFECGARRLVHGTTENGLPGRHPLLTGLRLGIGTDGTRSNSCRHDWHSRHHYPSHGAFRQRRQQTHRRRTHGFLRRIRNQYDAERICDGAIAGRPDDRPADARFAQQHPDRWSESRFASLYVETVCGSYDRNTGRTA